jgi:hypothetical protein
MSRAQRASRPYQPEWLTKEVNEALAAIAGEHVAKKETTVLRLAEATATGASWSQVFERADTCAKRVWYGTAKRPGWQQDPAVQRALAVATAQARWWVRVKRGAAVQAALDTLVDGSEVAAQQLVNLARYGQMLFVDEQGGTRVVAADVRDVLAAAKDILDRVSELTAAKGHATVGVTSDQMALLLQKAQQRAERLEAEAVQAWTE